MNIANAKLLTYLFCKVEKPVIQLLSNNTGKIYLQTNMKRTNRHRIRRGKNYKQFVLPQKSHKDNTAALRKSISTGADKEVLVYQSELDYLSRCILDYPNIETGGQLFGFHTAKGTPVVCYVIGPGTHANHQTTFFNQDLNYLETIGDVLTREYGLQHIGEWHSHHQLGLCRPSGYDAQTMHHSIDGLHLEQFLLCIGTTDGKAACINAFHFYENNQSYYPAKWNIKAEPSPYRKTIDERLNHLLAHPHIQEPCLKDMQISKISIARDADANYLLRAYNH